jgi:RND family efflux transporter MFP subunit
MKQKKPGTVAMGRSLVLSAALAAGWGALFVAPAMAADDGDYSSKSLSIREPIALTRPTEESELKALNPGIVDKILVKEGQVVKKDQPLIQQDDRIDLKLLESLQKEADSNIRVEAAEADMKAKKANLDRVQGMYKKGASSDLELEQAQLDYDFRVKQVALAQLEKTKNGLEADRQKLKVDSMVIKAPFDGMIKRIDVSPGEMLTPEVIAITVVKNDPLRLELTNLPVAQASKLKTGDKIQVRYPDEKEWRTATVTFLSPVANAKAGTREIHMELPNSENRAAGLQMVVKLPEAADSETAAARE